MSDDETPVTDDGTTVRRAEGTDFDRIRALLRDIGLPHEDLRPELGQFFVAVRDGAVVGTGGVEPHGDVGLLRSLAVAQRSRGTGVGTSLCRRLESRAADTGIETLYLSTTTAAEFFGPRGYETVPREEAPDPIRETTQFSELCPRSATCMRKRLRGEA